MLGLRRYIVSLLLVVTVGYAVVVLVLFFSQRQMLYFPPSTVDAPPAGVTLVMLETADHERLRAWYVPPKLGEPLFLYFGGNGEALGGDTARFAQVTETGAGFLAIAYRGYGGSTGKPTEEGLARDAEAAWAWAAARYPPERLVIHGHSLGTGVAVRLAAAHPARALVLEAPFSAAVDVAADHFKWAPVRWLMQDQFRSADRIAAVRMPILIVHGEDDAVIPIQYGRRLFAATKGPAKFVAVPRYGHDDLWVGPLYPNIWLFLKANAPVRAAGS